MYEIGTATDHNDLLVKLRTFLEVTLTAAERWVVQRTIGQTYDTIVSITSVAVTATVTHTSAHLLMTGDRVTISGCTEGEYNGTFSITVTSPTVYTYVMLADPAGTTATGTPAEVRNSTEVIWKAPGLSASEELYMGVKTYQLVSADFYNWAVSGFTGYVSSNNFETQPGTSGMVGTPLWNQAIPYWFVGNGQGVVVIAKIQNVYNSVVMGKMLPYATPAQWPYPMIIGGALTVAQKDFRYDNTAYVNWFKGNRENFKMRHVDGTWHTPQVLVQEETISIRNTITSSATADGYYGLHSLVLSELSPPNVFGDVDNLYMISGFNNAVENTVVVGGVTYVVFRDATRTGFKDYVALKLA